jgi:hypothetical protein
VDVDEDECKLFSSEEVENGFAFSNGLRAFSIHPSHLNKTIR